MTKKIIKVIVVVVVLAGLWFGWHAYKNRAKAPEKVFFRSQEVGRGSVVQEVTATGTIQPIKKVSVTTQVTGKIISLTADYNSRITEGEVIAEIDPDNYKSSLDNAKAQLASARAQLRNNEANLEKTIASLALAAKELERQKKLFEREMTTESDLDNAQATYDQLVATKKSNEASIEQSKASIAQAEASVRTAEKNLADCTITSPVNGIVIDRSVEEGQTVVSSMNATGLFTVATDLSRVKVEAAIPEADIGGVAVGQNVHFTVDAYKTRFKGVVTQIRLASTTNSNVVTYPVIIEAENPDERLFPGMTANLSIIIEEADDVVVVPNAATRFVPPGVASEGAAPAGRSGMPPVVAGAPPRGMGAGAPPAGFKPPQAGEIEVPVETRKTIWIADSDTEIHPVVVELGITDSVNTVVLKGGEELLGKKVVVGKQATAPGANGQVSNPFMPKPPSRRK